MIDKFKDFMKNGPLAGRIIVGGMALIAVLFLLSYLF